MEWEAVQGPRCHSGLFAAALLSWTLLLESMEWFKNTKADSINLGGKKSFKRRKKKNKREQFWGRSRTLCFQLPAQLLQGCFTLESRLEKQHKRLSPNLANDSASMFFSVWKKGSELQPSREKAGEGEAQRRGRVAGILSWICFTRGGLCGCQWPHRGDPAKCHSSCSMSWRAQRCYQGKGWC